MNLPAILAVTLFASALRAQTESRWPIATPFNELAARIVGGTATIADKLDFKKLAAALKESGRGPWWDRVRVAESRDGLNFTDLNTTVLEKASVPEAVVDRDGNVWLFFVDGDLDRWVERVEAGGPFGTGLMSLGAAKSADGIHFERVEMEIKNVNAGKNVDPDIVVAPDGLFHLYYLGVPAAELAPGTADPARAPGPHKFYLATSRDLVHWEQQGVAWTGPHGGADPAVYCDAKRWFILGGGAGVSDDGGRTFTPISMRTGPWGQPDVIAVNGGFRVFYSTLNGIRSAFSADGVNWEDEEGVRARGGADPSVVRMKDGSWRMYYKVGGRQPTAPQFAGRSTGGPPALTNDAPNRADKSPAPQRNSDGPWNHRVLLATSKDGLAWNVGGDILAERASVPELFLGPDDKPIMLFVDASGESRRGGLGAIVRQDDGSWERRETDLHGADPNVVRVKDGTYRGYTKDRDGAIIVFSSRDGLKWERLGVAFQDERYRQSTDSDVFETPDGWVMLVSIGPRLLRCTSADGLKFTTDGTMLKLGGSVSDTAKVAGGWRTFFHVNASPGTGGKMLIRSAFTADGRQWNIENGDRVIAPESGPASLGVADPAPVQLKDGTWLMAIKSFIQGNGGGSPTLTGRTEPDLRPDRASRGPSLSPSHAGEARVEGEQRDAPVRTQTFAHDDNFNRQPPDNPGAPGNRDILVYRVSRAGAVEKLATFAGGGAPTIARLNDGRIGIAHQHFPRDGRVNHDKMAVLFSGDDGKTWTAPQVIKVAGLPEGMPFAFDPTLVPLPDGRIRLYFTGNLSPPSGRGTPAIYSAVSPDCVNFTFEPGVRFDVAGRIIIDCAAVLHRGVFHLFVPDNDIGENPSQRPENEAAANRPREGAAYHATSTDGLNFTRVADLQIEGRRRWLGNAQSDGKLITFCGTGEGFNAGSGDRPGGAFWMATSEDGQAWELVANPPIGGGDPGAVKTRDGGMLVVVSGKPRPQTSGRRGGSQPSQDFDDARGQVHAEFRDSRYAVAPVGKPGRFVTGQDADLMLGGFGFDDSGGPLLFNHPAGIASDGSRFLVADRWNNRVLIWKTLPEGNSPPDLVLGQKDFSTNHPGTGRDEFNWPGNVSVSPDGAKLAVADTDNDRILLWHRFPETNAAPADVTLELPRLAGHDRPRLAWPWGVWTDGRRLAAVATHGASILVWNSLPLRDQQPPDHVITPREAGTPRNITSDGTFLMVGDHNNRERGGPATMVWRDWPAAGNREPDFTWGEWLKGTRTPDGKLVLGSLARVFVWNSFPRDGSVDADVVLRPASYRNGDGPDAVFAGGRLYVNNYNGNNVLAWNRMPARDGEPPDFSIGSDTPGQDTLAEHGFIGNPMPATDGKSLFVSSDFGGKLYVWRKLPDESAARADVTISLPAAPWDNALRGQTLVLAGKRSVLVWRRLPLNGEPPDLMLDGRIGGIEFQEITGVALDDRYFYLSDRQADKIYVWEGVPHRDSPPAFTLAMERPGRLSSNGGYLAAAPFDGASIHLWRVSELNAAPVRLGGAGKFNLPGKCLVAQGHLFVADTSFNRVHVWQHIEDALAGKPADALLGAKDDQDRNPEIGRDKLFGPAGLAFDGSYLWVGEFKFSNRLLRFSPKAGL